MEQPPAVEVTPEHHWLARLLGDWKWTTESIPGHEHPPMSGTETFSKIGDVWVHGVSRSEHGDNHMTLGFDTRTRRYVGTFAGAHMTHLWVYDGVREGDELLLDSTGPSFSGDGTLDAYRDVVELVGNDLRYLRAYVKGADGAWTHFMTMRYERV